MDTYFNNNVNNEAQLEEKDNESNNGDDQAVPSIQIEMLDESIKTRS